MPVGKSSLIRGWSAVWLLVIGVEVCHGQSMFLESGESGIGGSASGLMNSNGKALGVGLVYSIAGIVDFGLSVTRFSYDEDKFAPDLSETSWGPGVGLYVLKQSEHIPISIGLGGSYSRASLSNSALDQLSVDVKGTYWSFGGSVSRLVSLSEQTDFVPIFGVNHYNVDVTIDSGFGELGSTSDGSTSFNAGFAYAFGMGEGTRMYINPSVSFGDGDPAFSFSLGFVAGTMPVRQQAHPYDPTYPHGEQRGRHEWGQTESPAKQPYAQPSPPPVPPMPAPVIGDEQISAETLELLKRGTPEMTDMKISQLDTAQVAAIAQVFKVPASIIRTYRWARSMAPAGHANAGTVLFSVECGDQTFTAKETIRVNADGFVIERSKR